MVLQIGQTKSNVGGASEVALLLEEEEEDEGRCNFEIVLYGADPWFGAAADEAACRITDKQRWLCLQIVMFCGFQKGQCMAVPAIQKREDTWQYMTMHDNIWLCLQDVMFERIQKGQDGWERG